MFAVGNSRVMNIDSFEIDEAFQNQFYNFENWDDGQKRQIKRGNDRMYKFLTKYKDHFTFDEEDYVIYDPRERSNSSIKVTYDDLKFGFKEPEDL